MKTYNASSRMPSSTPHSSKPWPKRCLSSRGATRRSAGQTKSTLAVGSGLVLRAGTGVFRRRRGLVRTLYPGFLPALGADPDDADAGRADVERRPAHGGSRQTAWGRDRATAERSVSEGSGHSAGSSGWDAGPRRSADFARRLERRADLSDGRLALGDEAISQSGFFALQPPARQAAPSRQRRRAGEPRREPRSAAALFGAYRDERERRLLEGRSGEAAASELCRLERGRGARHRAASKDSSRADRVDSVRPVGSAARLGRAPASVCRRAHRPDRHGLATSERRSTRSGLSDTPGDI